MIYLPQENGQLKVFRNDKSPPIPLLHPLSFHVRGCGKETYRSLWLGQGPLVLGISELLLILNIFWK
jgi:hypothetical protein